MKRKFKFLSAAACLSVVSPIIAITSCSQTSYSEFAEFIQKEALNEFYDICPIYRRSFYTRNICDHLKKRITEFGLGDSVVEDDYRTTPNESSGNMMFEIPATNGWEKQPKIILQAHMDMVWVAPESYDKSKGVIPVQEGDRIHSKDFKTTLGADNGIGLGILLALAKNRNRYNHGPIRCIITTDEEESPVGATKIDPDWLDADYLVNIDHEWDDQILVSCAGCQELEFNHYFGSTIIPQTTTTGANIYQYKVKISGLKGGHSGLEIGKNKMNAVLTMADFVEYVMHAPKGDNVYLISALSPGTHVYIPTEITFTFATTTDFATIKEYRNNFVGYSKFMHPVETDLEIEVENVTPTAGVTTYGLDLSTSNQVLEYLTILPFGTLSYDETGAIETCANVGGVVNSYSKELGEAYFSLEYLPLLPGQENMHLAFGIQGRSSNPEHLGPHPGSGQLPEYGFYYYIANATNHVFNWRGGGGKIEDYLTSSSWLPAWQYRNTKMYDILYEASKENKAPMLQESTLAWAETGWFNYKKPGLESASIGCKIRNSHESSETVYISSIKNLAFNLIYLLDHIKQLPAKGGN